MHKTQVAYALAKAQYEAATAIVTEEIEKIAHLRDENFELWCDKYHAIRDQHRATNLFETMRQAELDMINWANEKVSQSPYYKPQHKETIATVMANLHQPRIRKQIVDMAFRLQ